MRCNVQHLHTISFWCVFHYNVYGIYKQLCFVSVNKHHIAWLISWKPIWPCCPPSFVLPAHGSWLPISSALMSSSSTFLLLLLFLHSLHAVCLFKLLQWMVGANDRVLVPAVWTESLYYRSLCSRGIIFNLIDRHSNVCLYLQIK